MVIRSTALLGAMAACAFLFTAPAVQAADITVNSTADTGDAVAGDGTCGSGVPNSCTLRAAITEANGNAQVSNRILFSVTGSTTLLSALPTLTKPVEIDGGTSGFTVNGNDLFSLVDIPSGAASGAYLLKKLTLNNGSRAAGGGVFFAPTAQASLTLTDVVITSSRATGGNGGGLSAELLAVGSSLTLLRVDINGNSATGNGGGLWLRLGATGSMSLDDSTIAGNTAGLGGNGSGGGIFVRRGRLNVGNTTISTNVATGTGQGGGLFLDSQDIGGSVRLENSTVSGNTNDGIAVQSGNPAASWVSFTTITNNNGMGIRSDATATHFPGNVSNPFTSNIVANNGTNCSTAITHSDAANSGYNMTDSTACGFAQATDKVVAAPADLKLAGLNSNPLTNPTTPQTHALLAGSLAIDAGNNAWSTGADQRGADSQDGGADGSPGDSTAVRDIGAYEFGGFGLVQFGFTTGTNFDAPEDVTPAVLSIRRYGTGTAATTAPTVAFTTTATTATQGACGSGGSDYTELASNPTEFTFTGTAGLTQFERTASLAICKDQAVEGDETFAIALSDAAAGDSVGFDFGPKASGTVTIVDRENGEFKFDNAVSPHAANEGNAGSNGSITLTILRTSGTGTYGAVRVAYSTTTTCSPACTAESNDFTAVTSGTVDFANGETSKTITVNFVGDAAYEVESGGGETFRVTLDGVQCLNLQAGQSCDAHLVGTASDANRFALVEITNDDTAAPGQFQFSATGYTALEASGSVTITVKRVGGTDGAVDVDCGTANGTGAGAATSGVGNDFLTPANNPDPLHPCLLSWTNGDAADKTFAVTLNNDSAVESNKTFSVTLSNPAGGVGGQTPTVATPSATVTLVSDEQPQFVFSTNGLSVAEGSSVQPTLQWTTFTGGDVTMPYYTVDGTATSPVDYMGIPQGTPTTLTITAAQANSLLLNGIATYADGPEGNETFTVQLGTPGNGGQLGTDDPLTAGVTEAPATTVTITDPPSAVFTATSFTRANEANNSTIALTVHRQGNTAQSMDVDFTISAACATAPCATESVDYTRSGGFTGTVHWNAGITTDQTINITVIGDTLIEGDEGIKVTLSNARVNGSTAADLGTPSTATAVIPDDDYRFEVVDTSPITIGEAGGNAVVTVRRFGSTIGTATVNYDTADGTAVKPGDYTQTTGTLTWNAGVGGTQTISVPVVGDAVDENTESFTVALASPSNNSSGEATPITGSPVTVQITDDDTAGVTVTQSGGATAVAEGGATDTYTIVLNSQPTADVTIAVTGDADAGGSPASLTFTNANWNVAQTVTVTATDDAIAEGSHGGTLTHAATSSDPAYNGITVASVSATIADNDTAGVTVTESGGATAVTEAGATDTYTVVLTSQPTADVTIAVSGDADAGGSPASLTFTSANWNVAQAVTVSATDDAIAEGAHSGTLTHAATSADAGYNGIAVASVTAAIADNDTAGVTVTQSGGSTALTEGAATDTYDIVLTSQPTADVTIAVTGDADVTGSPASLTFTSANWNVAQTVTATAVNDAQAEGAHSGTLTHAATSADGGYNGITVASVTASITDNDTAGVTVTQSGGATAVTEGGATDTYTLVLTSQPGANVTITVTGDADVSGSPASVTFTSANWNVAQAVTVTAVNDALAEGTHGGALTHAATSADAGYNGIAVAPVTVTITDNDVVGVTVAASGGSTAVTEGGATDTVTVRLNSQPAANVTITLSPDTQLTVSPTSLTFTPANWNAPQTVTVTAVDDAQTEGAHSGSIGASMASTDAAYNGALPATSVTITDNDGVVAGEDAPGVVVTPSGNAAAGGGGGGAFSWSALLGLLALAGLRRRAAAWAAVLGLVSAPALADGIAVAQAQPKAAQAAPAPKARTAAASSRFSYDSIDVRYVSVKVDDPSVDAAGFALAGSWGLGKTFYTSVGYSAVETDNFRLQGVVGATETTSMSLGLGLHAPAGRDVDFTAVANLISAEAEGQGGFRGSSDDTGYGVEGGLRGRLSPTFEWSATLSWVSIFGDDDTALLGQTQWRVGRNFGVLAGAGFGSNSSQLSAGLRYSF